MSEEQQKLIILPHKVPLGCLLNVDLYLAYLLCTEITSIQFLSSMVSTVS